MTDLELVGILRISDEPCHQHAANRIEALRSALGSMLESYGRVIGECPSTETPLIPSAVDALKRFFPDAKKCNAVFHAD